MKGYALAQRDKKKDAYDIYFSVRNYQGGLDKLADACEPLLDDPVAREGYSNIAARFDRADGYGPATVRMFLEGTAMPEGMTPEQVQQDAFRQIEAWLRKLGIVS